MNIFTQIHITAKGKNLPIVSMNDEHLFNTIKLQLVKRPKAILEQYINNEYAEYAPEGMDEKVRKSLGKKKMPAKMSDELQVEIDEVEMEALEQALERMQPYLIVALCRDTLHLPVRDLLIELTGITTRVDLPSHTTYPTITEEEVLELTGGYPFEGDDE